MRKNTYNEKEREFVKFGHCKLEEKGKVSFQAISSITSTRIIKKGVLDYSLHQRFEDNLGVVADRHLGCFQLHAFFFRKKEKKMKVLFLKSQLVSDNFPFLFCFILNLIFKIVSYFKFIFNVIIFS